MSLQNLTTDDRAAGERSTNATSLTWLLILLLMGVGCLALFAYSQLAAARDNALRAQADLLECSDDLADLAAYGTSSAPLAADSPALSAPLGQAANDAGISGKLASVQPGQAQALRESDYTETPVYVRLNSVSLRQTLTFLYNLSSANANVRAKTIELTPDPSTAKAGGEELWTTDLTLAYLSYTPREKQR